MFSRVVSAARGLLAGQESSASPQDQTESQKLEFKSEPESQSEKLATEKAMVTATRSSTFSRQEDADTVTTTTRTGSPIMNGNSNAKGKRKSASSTADDVADSRTNKRRKGSVNGDAGVEREGRQHAAPESESVNGRRFRSLQSVEIVSERPHIEQASSPNERYQYSSESVEDGVSVGNADSEPIPGPAHVRFSSEIPDSNAEEEKENDISSEGEEDHTTNGHAEAVSEEESDDEAPEAVSNVTRLRELKDAERKRDEAKKRYVRLVSFGLLLKAESLFSCLLGLTYM